MLLVHGICGQLRYLGPFSQDWYNDDLGRRIASFKLLDSFAITPLDDYEELWLRSETVVRERKILAQAEENGSRITSLSLGQHDIWTKKGDNVWESRFETSECNHPTITKNALKFRQAKISWNRGWPPGPVSQTYTVNVATCCD